MKLMTIAYLSLLFVVFSVAQQEEDDEEKKMAKFKEFKKRHRRTYNGALERVHFRRWKRRRSVIKGHNTIASLGESSFQISDNQFADQSEEEWETYLLGVAIPEEFVDSSESEEITTEIAAPTDEEIEISRQVASLDLRTNPCMPPVKTQAPCGACWAFVATTAVEYQMCVKNRNRTALVLSEQQLIDCSGNYGTKGCNGGFYTQAWDYIMAVGGQTTNSTYPFKAAAGECRFTRGSTQVTGKISRYVFLAKNEATILTALQRGPITVSIVANPKFILYSSGIFDDDSCKNGTINHGVVLVGYGRANDTDYWIVRNSWGTAWGQNGHILMKRNVNICRIAEFAFLATV